MVWFWCIIAVTLLSFGFSHGLSARAARWPGLILPAVYFCAASIFLLLNLLHVFPQAEAFGSFLVSHGSAGFFALLLKIGLVYAPFAAHLILYFAFRRAYEKTHHPARKNRDLRKMLADDLE